MSSKITVPSNLANIDNLKDFQRYTAAVINQLVQAANSVGQSISTATGAVTTGATSRIYRSNSCGVFSTASATFVDVTNLFVNNFMSTGHPIRVELIHDGSTGNASFGLTSAATNVNAQIQILRNGVAVYNTILSEQLSAGNVQVLQVPPTGIGFDDVVSAGTYTYTVQVACSATSVTLNRVKLQVYEKLWLTNP